MKRTLDLAAFYEIVGLLAIVGHICERLGQRCPHRDSNETSSIDSVRAGLFSSPSVWSRRSVWHNLKVNIDAIALP